MTITHSLIRLLALWSLAAALLVAGVLPGGHARAEPAKSSSLELIKTALDQIEEAVGREDATQEALVELRQKLNAAADDLRGRVDELEPRAREAEERLKQLGPAGEGCPSRIEGDRRPARRTHVDFNELDGDLKQARVLTVRTDQLSERISQRRHALYASELFARTSSIFNPFFWADAFRALPIELRRAEALMESLVVRPRQQRARGWRRLHFALHHRGRDRVDEEVVSPPAARRLRHPLGESVDGALGVPLARCAHAGGKLRHPAGVGYVRAADVSCRADRRGPARPYCRRRVRSRRRPRAVRSRAAGTPAGAGGRRHRSVLSQPPGLGHADTRGADRPAGDPQDPVCAAHRHDCHQRAVRSGNGRVPSPPGHAARASAIGARMS